MTKSVSSKESAGSTVQAARRLRPALARAPGDNPVAVAKTTIVARQDVPKKPSPEREMRRNRRSDKTVQNILDATEKVILKSGAERISILEVCTVAHISRGTFYRYFESQDDLLDAFSRHTRDRFHSALVTATAPYSDPDQRFQAVVLYLDGFLKNSQVQRLLIVAPDYAIRWFQRIFHDSMIRFQDVLASVFDAWEERLGVSLERELVCELMVRYILSEVLVPAGPDRLNLPRRIERLVSTMVSGRIFRR